MIQNFVNRFNLNLLLTVLFIAGIGASLYVIYSLPVSLRLADGYQPEFIRVYLVTGATLFVGLITLTSSLRYKKEVIVFRDKVIDKEEAQREAAEQAGKTTINLDVVRNSLSAATQKEALTQALHIICKQLNAGQGALYLAREQDGKRTVELFSGYALNIAESKVLKYEFGEGLVGQVAASGQTLFIDDVPEGYITILSGLGNASPRFLLLVPVKSNNRLQGVMEIASFERATEDERKFVEESAQLMTETILSKE
jgi:putative methionine-R-sulfoxide reductase with GAF domain